MTTEPALHTQAAAMHDDWTPVRFDGFQFLLRILRQWKFIAVCTVLAALLSLTYALSRKPFYTAKASFLPPERDLATSGPAITFFAPSLQNATFLGFLQSSTVLHDVVNRLDLVEVYHAPDADAAAAILSGNSKPDVAQNGIVSIEAQADTPQLAADIANAYLQAVHDLTQKMSEESLSQRVSFYTGQLQQSRRSLEQAEAELQANQERGGILDPTGSTQLAISNQARLLTAIQQAQVQLSSLRQSNTESSPEVVRARSQLDELRSQLAQQSAKSGTAARGLQAGGALPGLTIEASRRVRDVREREAVYEALLKQTELTQMNETDPGPQLQVIDRARVPRRKAGPGRMKYLLIGTAAGFFLSFLWAAAGGWIRGFGRRVWVSLQREGA